VLRRDEWRWWPLAPWLAWQAWRTVRRVPRLPPAADVDGSVPGPDPEFRLLVLGDSTAAGVGCDTHAEALAGATARALAVRLGRAVRWHARGASGATAADVRRALLGVALAWNPDLVVLSVGVNDSVRGRASADFEADLRAIVAAFARSTRPARVIHAGVPPLSSFPSLPAPLAALLGARATRLDRAARQVFHDRGAYVAFPPRLATDAFAHDGFHPGAAGCRAWAGWIVEAIEAGGGIASPGAVATG
jgi:lysophospholipase L1-like esterase